MLDKNVSYWKQKVSNVSFTNVENTQVQFYMFIHPSFCILSPLSSALSPLISLFLLFLLSFLFLPFLSPPLSTFRCAVRPRQQGELHRHPGGRYGRLHRILGQLPQTVELKHPSGGKHQERRRRRGRGGGGKG